MSAPFRQLMRALARQMGGTPNPGSPPAPLREALQGALRAPDAGSVGGNAGPWFRGGVADGQNGMTFLTQNRDLARSFARDLHGVDEVSEIAPSVGRQMVVDWDGRPWDSGPSGLTTERMAQIARDEGYDSILLRNVESMRGSPGDELVILRPQRRR